MIHKSLVTWVTFPRDILPGGFVNNKITPCEGPKVEEPYVKVTKHWKKVFKIAETRTYTPYTLK